MTRPAVLPMPAAQMALAEARRTIRAADATPAQIARACAVLQAHGNWMDLETARALRTAQRPQACPPPHEPQRTDPMTRPTNNPPFRPAFILSRIAFALLGAVVLAALFALIFWTAPAWGWVWPILRTAGVLLIVLLIRDLLADA